MDQVPYLLVAATGARPSEGAPLFEVAADSDSSQTACLTHPRACTLLQTRHSSQDRQGDDPWKGLRATRDRPRRWEAHFQRNPPCLLARWFSHELLSRCPSLHVFRERGPEPSLARLKSGQP